MNRKPVNIDRFVEALYLASNNEDPRRAYRMSKALERVARGDTARAHLAMAARIYARVIFRDREFGDCGIGAGKTQEMVRAAHDYIGGARRAQEWRVIRGGAS